MLVNILDRAVSVLQLIRGSGMAVLVFGREAAPGLQHHTYPAVVGGKDEGPLLNHGERWSEASHMHLVDMESRRVKQGAQTVRRGGTGEESHCTAVMEPAFAGTRGLCPLPEVCGTVRV